MDSLRGYRIVQDVIIYLIKLKSYRVVIDAATEIFSHLDQHNLKRTYNRSFRQFRLAVPIIIGIRVKENRSRTLIRIRARARSQQWIARVGT